MCYRVFSGLATVTYSYLFFGSHNLDFSCKKSGSLVNSRPFSWQSARSLHPSATQPHRTAPPYSATSPACFSLHPTCSPVRRLLKLNEYSWENHFTLPQSSWLLKNGCCFLQLETMPNLWRLLGVPTYISSVAIICIVFYSFKFDTPSSHTKLDVIPHNEESNFQNLLVNSLPSKHRITHARIGAEETPLPLLDHPSPNKAGLFARGLSRRAGHSHAVNGQVVSPVKQPDWFKSNSWLGVPDPLGSADAALGVWVPFPAFQKLTGKGPFLYNLDANGQFILFPQEKFICLL